MQQQLKLMRGIISKLMQSLSQVGQMCNQFFTQQSIQQSNTTPQLFDRKEKKSKPITLNPKLFPENIIEADQSSQIKTRKQVKSGPKQLFTYHQRIKALRNINRHLQLQKQSEKGHKKGNEGRQVKLTPFFIYLKQKRNRFQQQYPQISPSELLKLLKQDWSGMSAEQKQPYIRQHNQNYLEFTKRYRQYEEQIFDSKKELRNIDKKDD